MGRNQDGKQNQVKSAKKSFEAQLDSAWRGIVAPLLLSAYLFSLCTATFYSGRVQQNTMLLPGLLLQFLVN